MSVARTAHLNFANVTGTVNTQAFNCAGGDTLVVLLEDGVNTAGNTTGCTYNGVAMTEVGRIGPSGQVRELVAYALHNPASGSNNIVATRTSSSVGRFVLSAFAISGTDTGAALAALCQQAQGSGTGTTFTLGNTTNAYACAIAKFTSAGQSSGTGSTLINTYDIMSDYEASTLPVPNTSYSFQVQGSSSSWGAIVVVIPEASAGPIQQSNFLQFMR